MERRVLPANFLVTSGLDDGSPGTLRNIMGLADANNEADTITFQSGITSITLATGHIGMTIDKNDLTINGPGITVSGAAMASATNRIFNFNVAGGNPTFTIDGLTLTGGKLSAGNGGAILINNEGLVLKNVMLINNFAPTSGGAIATTASGTSIECNNVTATGNSATTSGGVIFTPASSAATLTFKSSFFSMNTSGIGSVVQGMVSTTLNIADCTLSSNSSTATGSGGAIALQGASSAITINKSTFSTNTARGGAGLFVVSASVLIENSTFNDNVVANGSAGGAIRYASAIGAGGFTIRNSTFVGNLSGLRGGAVGFTSIGTGTAKFENCTFTGNLAADGGGAIGVSAGSGTILLESCIVSENKLTGTGLGPDFELLGTTSLMAINSLIGSTLGAPTNALDSVSASLLGLPPRLGPLADNGGPTRTVALQLGSPAINKGSNPGSLIFDQRGGDDGGPLLDYPRTRFGATDIGSFEFDSSVPIANAFAPHVPPALGTVTVTVYYNDDLAIDESTIDIDDVSLGGLAFAMPVAPTSVTTIGSGSSVTAKYEFPTPVGGWNGLHTGVYTVQMNPNQVRDTVGGNFVPPGTIGLFKVAIESSLVVNDMGDVDDMDRFNGKMTLREALSISNANSGLVDTITFDPSFSGKTLVLSGTEFTITDPFHLLGPGAGLFTISANLDRRFATVEITGAFADKVSTISGVTFANFKSSSAGGVLVTDNPIVFSEVDFVGNQSTTYGGAVFVGATTVTMEDCTATGNQTPNRGGVIGTGVGTVILNRSTFSGNQANQGGGALYMTSSGVFTIIDSTLEANVTTNGDGGALNAITGTVTLLNSTVSGNSAKLAGGGIRTSTGNFTITNSTITGNVLTGIGVFGGGIHMSSAATITINNSTITKNSANGGGGGINIGNHNAKLTLNSTILAQNIHASHPDLFSSVTIPINVTANKCIVGVAADSDLNVVNSGSQIGTIGSPVNAVLGDLSNHGGPTKTHALLASSPAIDNGSNPAMLTNDQRGVGYSRVVGLAADIGAFEVQPIQLPQVTGILINNGNSQRSMVTSIKVTFNEPVTLSPSAFQLVRYANGSTGTIGVAVNQVGNEVALTFDNTGSIVLDPGGSLPDGSYQLTIVANHVTGMAGKLDGNKNGVADGSPADDVTSKLHRLFGDGDGNGTVNAADFALFRSFFGLTGASFFDFNEDNSTNTADFAQFRSRFGLTLTP